ncbi:MAG: glycosyltransferase family 2 protein [Pararhodobacter sp.]
MAGIMRDTPEPGWGLVLLAREPAALVLSHLAWHLDLGAREIHLYLDDPADPAADAAANLPGVQITRCDDRFWQALAGARPALQTRRQTLVASHAYVRAGVDWLLHLDADEFVHAPAPVAAELARHADFAGYLALPNLERAFTRADPACIFEGVFRRPLPRGAELPAALAHQEPFVVRGVCGHAAGKAISRTGQGYRLQPHAPRLDGAQVPSRRANGLELLHFDGLTPLHWLLKLMRYAQHPPESWARFLGPHRRAQLEHVRENLADPHALRAFHDRLKTCPEPEALTKVGLIDMLPFAPETALRRWLAEMPDLSVAAFDAALRAREPALCLGL